MRSLVDARRRPALVVIALAAAACNNPFAAGRRAVLAVTDLRAPATFARGEAFDVTLDVQVGGCLEFTRLHAERGPARLTLTAEGRDHSGPDVACPADIRIESHAYRVAAPWGDSLVVDVVQARGVILGAVVRRR